jgi:hypothetical protein
LNFFCSFTAPLYRTAFKKTVESGRRSKVFRKNGLGKVFLGELFEKSFPQEFHKRLQRHFFRLY